MQHNATAMQHTCLLLERLLKLRFCQVVQDLGVDTIKAPVRIQGGCVKQHQVYLWVLAPVSVEERCELSEPVTW